MNNDLLNLEDLEENRCPNGCPSQDIEILNARDRLYSIGHEFKIVKCVGCKLIRTSPRPNASSIHKYYPDQYHPYINGLTPPHKRGWIVTLAKQLVCAVRRSFETFGQALPVLPPGSLLEIGCASGQFLTRMRAIGWDSIGIEPSESASQRAREAGCNVITGTIENIQTLPQKFDLIVAWMVLEHLHEPCLALSKVYTWANDDARLVLSVPNAGSKLLTAFGPYNYNLDCPRHLFHFTPETLTSILEQNGWTVEKVLQQRTLASLVGSITLLVESLGVSRSFAKLLMRISPYLTFMFWPLTVLLSGLGETGRMTIWCKKNAH